MLDRVEITVRGGNGGNGAVSFRREKFVPLGGPDGGDGGDGGNVFIVADASIDTLGGFRGRRVYRAANGEHGHGKKQHGKNGEDTFLMVPVGTIVIEKDEEGEGIPLADLKEAGDQVVVAKGGKGGRGNARFATPSNQAPRIAERGEPGQERSLVLELRLIADVGIIGHPNVGKSSLLTAATAAQPKIASYPFTTLQPVLGVVEVGQKTFILAEIPGLIEGAHLGRGLGHDFLRHALRTRMLVHLVDGISQSPVEQVTQVNAELSLFDPSLGQKPQIVVVNKVDLPEVRARMDKIRDAFREAGIPVRFISAASGEGVRELMRDVVEMLDEIKAKAEAEEKAPVRVFRPEPRRPRFIVRREGDIYIIDSPTLERVVSRVDMTSDEVRTQLKSLMSRMGIARALEKAGIQPGDKVQCGEVQWEW